MSSGTLPLPLPVAVQLALERPANHRATPCGSSGGVAAQAPRAPRVKLTAEQTAEELLP